MRRALFGAAVGPMAAAMLQGPARAEEVRISVGSFNLNNLPFPLTGSLGFYEAEGPRRHHRELQLRRIEGAAGPGRRIDRHRRRLL